MLTAERGMLVTPDYPSLHHGPVECLWEIKGMPGEVVAIDVKEFDINNCNASRLEVRDRDNDTLIGSYCGGAKPGRIESHGNQMTVKFISTGSREGERFKVEFQRGNFLLHSANSCNFRYTKCTFCFENLSLNGIKVGRFFQQFKLSSISTNFKM